MNSPAAYFVPPRRMDIYAPFQQMGAWEESLKAVDDSVVPDSLIIEVDMKYDNQSEGTSQGTPTIPNKYDRQASNRFDKIQRRLAQNREAARKCRLRKKAYVQLLETSRLKLMQIEKELERAKQQGAYAGVAESSHTGFSGSVNNTGIEAFELEYGRWIEEQDRQICELRNALQAQVNDVELRVLVENGMSHYSELFRMKANAAKANVFYVMSGLWRTPSERFFLWIGGFRPSEILKIVTPTIDLTDHQLVEICKLRQSCQQAEDALSQGLEKLQQNVSDAVAGDQLGKGNYFPQVATAMEKLEALASFVNQADHIRQETLKQMARIMTTHQAALGLIALGEYFQRLRKLSSLWSGRPSKTT